MKQCDVRDATRVSRDGIERLKIASKWGIRPDGRLAPPSQGGFGVFTEDGERISMMEAHSYWREDESAPVKRARVRRIVPPGTA
jgi:hypothetical protein